MSTGLKDLTYLVSSNVILKFLGIISIVVYTRYLSQAEIALFPFFTVVGRFSMVVFSFGLLQTLVRDIPHLLQENKMEDVRSHIITSLIFITPGIFLFSAIFYYFSGDISSYYFNTSSYTYYLEWMSVGIFFSGINAAFAFIYWALSRFKQESNRMVIVGFLQVITTVIFVILWGIAGLVASLIISSFISTLIYVHNLKDILSITSVDVAFIRKLILESIPFYLESYLMFFREQGDQLFVATLLGPNALAIYFIAKKPYDILSSFTISLDQVLTTSLAKFKNNKVMFDNKVNSIITLNSYIVFPIILLAIGICPIFITLIAGKGYGNAVVPSILLLLWLIIQVSWRTALGRSLFVLKSSAARLTVTLVETVTLFGFMFILGNMYSLLGVVIGRLIATIIAGVYAYFSVKNYITINLDIKSIATVTLNSIITCLLLLIAQHIFNNYVYVCLSFLFCISLFFLLVNRTVSDKYYTVLNSILPFKITDPVIYILRKVRNFKP